MNYLTNVPYLIVNESFLVNTKRLILLVPIQPVSCLFCIYDDFKCDDSVIIVMCYILLL